MLNEENYPMSYKEFEKRVIELFLKDYSDETLQVMIDRVDEELKNDPTFTLGAFSYKYKCQKQKGEIIDEWQQVTVKKLFNEEKDPCTNVEVSYEVC